MLTQSQLDKLKILIQHSKFGKLLQDAIEVWKTNISPEFYSFGVSPTDFEFVLDNYECCLIGAGLLGKKAKEGRYTTYTAGISHHFDISEEEAWEISRGFDGCENIHTNLKSANDFGLEVRKIILNE